MSLKIGELFFDEQRAAIDQLASKYKLYLKTIKKCSAKNHGMIINTSKGNVAKTITTGPELAAPAMLPNYPSFKVFFT